MFAALREITKMKLARGAGGTAVEAEDDDIQVVQVESTSEYEKLLFFRESCTAVFLLLLFFI